MHKLPTWLIDSDAAMRASSYQRPPLEIAGQRLTGFQRARYEKLLVKIKQELLVELIQTEQATRLDGSFRVSLFRNLHYIREADGSYHVMNGDLNEWTSSVDSNTVLIYPPAALTDQLVTLLLERWKDLIGKYINLIETHYSHLTPSRCFESSIIWELNQTIKQFIRRSIYWDNFRLKLGDMLKLDDEVLDLALRSRINTNQRSMTVAHYNMVLQNVEIYREVNRQLPNLLWLITYFLRRRLRFDLGKVLAQCREYMLQESIGKGGWRLLCNSQISQFGNLLNRYSILPEVIQYLRLHQVLSRRRLIGANISYLFDHPEWEVSPGSVNYRGIQFQPQLMNKYIDEVNRLHKEGFRADEISFETAPVLTWLLAKEQSFDHVQLKKPWDWFLSKSLEWLENEHEIIELSKHFWNPVYDRADIGGYCFVEVTDAWNLMDLATRQRHCIDRYRRQLKSGQSCVFDVGNKTGKTIATMLLSKSSYKWEIEDISGFANKPVSEEIWNAGLMLVQLVNQKCTAKAKKIKLEQTTENPI